MGDRSRVLLFLYLRNKLKICGEVFLGVMEGVKERYCREDMWSSEIDGIHKWSFLLSVVKEEAQRMCF